MNLYSASASYYTVMDRTGGNSVTAERAHARTERLRIRKAQRKTRVGRQDDIRPTRDDLSAGHRASLRSRRQRQLSRTNGFDPVPNVKVGNAFNAAMIARVKQGLAPVDAHNAALRDVARILPPARRCRPEPRPSKSDAPKYRKVTVLKAFREGHGG